MLKKFFKYIKFGVILVVFGIIAFFGLYIYALITPKPDINKARSYYLYDKDSELVFNNNDEWISLDNISDYLINATIYTEDKKFYKHNGFDFLRIIKAVYVNLLSGSKKEGPQQLRNNMQEICFWILIRLGKENLMRLSLLWNWNATTIRERFWKGI